MKKGFISLAPKYNLTNNRYGKLIVIRMFRNSKKQSWYCECKCECGNIKNIQPHHLIAGRTISCGCAREQYQKITGSNHVNFTGYKEIPGGWWSKIKSRAINRDMEFTITQEFIYDLYEKQNKKCKLSGIDIQFGNTSKTRTVSIDRIDSNIGYIPSNIQLIHKDINIMKNCFENSYFIEICKKISNNN